MVRRPALRPPKAGEANERRAIPAPEKNPGAQRWLQKEYRWKRAEQNEQTRWRGNVHAHARHSDPPQFNLGPVFSPPCERSTLRHPRSRQPPRMAYGIRRRAFGVNDNEQTLINWRRAEGDEADSTGGMANIAASQRTGGSS
jgi:hypothetical protein